MQDEYDFDKMKRRPGPVKVDPECVNSTISIRMKSIDLADIKTEARRSGLPYQTLINSILHRYVTGELIDKKELQKAKSILNPKKK
jgi:predicted DNA binding CopG/RHH family protein